MSATFAPLPFEPGYRRVASAIAARILDRTLRDGDPLPSELELAAQFVQRRGLGGIGRGVGHRGPIATSRAGGQGSADTVRKATTMIIQCRCGAVELEIASEPLVQFFCHCDDC